MKKRILFSVAVLLSLLPFVQAEESKEAKKLGVSFDLTYMSKYINKGAESYGNKGAFFETVNFDLWGTGFGVSVGHQSATSSGYVDKQRFNYGVNYGGSLFDGEAYKTLYKINWVYKDYYGRARTKGNTQEWIFDFSWPDALPIENLTPYYITHYEYPAGSGYDNRDTSGWVHRFGLNYDLGVSGLPEPVKLSSEIAYTDGYGGPTKDHDWSYSTFGASTKFKLAKNLALVPGLYYQLSMDDSVNDRDELYCKISMRYTF